MEIGEEASLEAIAGAPLELAGERERVVWAHATGMAISSSRRGC